MSKNRRLAQVLLPNGSVASRKAGVVKTMLKCLLLAAFHPHLRFLKQCLQTKLGKHKILNRSSYE
jgi:agmatine/peptidylarginine deiminase